MEEEEEDGLMERVTEKCSYTQPTGLSGVREERDELSIFQSHSCRDLALHPRYLGCVRVCAMVSSSLPGDMALCFTARSAVTTTSTSRAVTCRC